MIKSELLDINKNNYKRTATYMFKMSDINFRLMFKKKKRRKASCKSWKAQKIKDFSKKSHGND